MSTASSKTARTGLALFIMAFMTSAAPTPVPASQEIQPRKAPPEKLEPTLSLTGHAERVFTVAFSPDGGRIASASGDKTVKVWESATGKLLATLQGHTQAVYAAAFSPDGRRLATAAGDLEKDDAPPRPGEVKIWDLATGKETLALQGLTGPVYRVAFHPDGRRLATAGGESKADKNSPGRPGEIKIWDLADGKEALTLTGHKMNVYAVLFSPDGKRLISAGGDFFQSAEPGEVKIWDLADGKEQRSLTGHAGPVYSVALSPDGTRLATAAGDKAVRLWDPATGKLQLTLRGYTGPVFNVAFDPTGRLLATAGKDQPHAVRVWNLDAPRLPLVFKAHADDLNGVAFSPDGRRLVTAGDDCQVKVWDLAPLAEAVRRSAVPTRRELEPLWEDLASEETPRVYRALWTLAAAPKEAVPLLRERLRPPKPDDPRVARLIADLNSDTFAVREKAHRELERWGPAAEPALRRTLANPASQEVRRRVERLLSHQSGPSPDSPDLNRLLRAIAVLEHLGTPEARTELETLTKGLFGRKTAEEAKAALERLDN